MLRRLLLLCVLCLISRTALATEADFEKRMARGVAALDAGDTASARAEFNAALTEHPDDHEAALFLAIALNRDNDPAAESALKTSLRLDPGNQRINLELGTFYYNRHMYEESADFFENLLAQKPDPETVAAAEGYLANIRRLSSAKRWGITLMGGMEYDSNVPQVAAGGPLPVGIERKSDVRGVLNLGLTGTVFRDSHQELTAGYSLYQTLHVHLTDFNLTQNQLDISYKQQVSSLLTAKMSAGFESILMGGNQYVNDFSISPGVQAALVHDIIIGFDYRFRDSSYHNTDLFPTSTDRNGETHSIMLSYHQPLSEILNLRLGYTFEREITAVSAWSSSYHLGSAGLAVTLPHSLLLDVSAEASARDYDQILQGAEAIRSDTTVTGAASLTWMVNEHLAASVGYHYSNNSSNISGYEYRRNITSIMVQGRY
jgi:hypothetical protein